MPIVPLRLGPPFESNVGPVCAVAMLDYMRALIREIGVAQGVGSVARENVTRYNGVLMTAGRTMNARDV